MTTPTPAEFLDSTRTVLFVHAHPDDETLWSGNLMAELAARGARTALVTTNRGELGQVVDPALAHLFGTDELGPHRARELAAALRELAGDAPVEHVWLGRSPARAGGLADRDYRDSGMRWVREGVAGPDLEAAADARSFTTAPIDEPTADLAAFVEALRPDAIVTYDAHGGYGHPDHVRAHEISVAAGRAAGVPVWAIVLRMDRHDDARADIWFDLPHRTAHVRRALAHYPTQLILTADGSVRHEDGFTHPVPDAVGLTRIA